MRQQKIMVVDDEPDLQMLILQKFRKEIKEDQYEFCFAENGKEALDMLDESNGISLVLSDINMPKMDGLTFLSELQELKDPALKTVMVSAYGDMDNIRKAMNLGAFDFVTKPINFDDLSTTIEKALTEINYLKKTIEERKRLNSVQRDLDTATRIQQKMLPQDFPPFPDKEEFEIYAEMITAKEVGGDLYDFFFIDEEERYLGFVIGDVSGKGVPASLYMAVSRTMLKAIASQVENPAECLNQVNSMLIPESDMTTFVTVFYGVLDTQTGKIRYCNGGHNLPYIIKSDGTVNQVENTGGLLLGKIEPVEFETKEIQLEAGEKIVLYTDGVVEAVGEDGEMYDEELYEQFLEGRDKDSSQKIVQSTMVEVLQFVGKADQSDDITVLGLRYLGES